MPCRNKQSQCRITCPSSPSRFEMQFNAAGLTASSPRFRGSPSRNSRKVRAHGYHPRIPTGWTYSLQLARPSRAFDPRCGTNSFRRCGSFAPAQSASRPFPLANPSRRFASGSNPKRHESNPSAQRLAVRACWPEASTLGNHPHKFINAESVASTPPPPDSTANHANHAKIKTGIPFAYLAYFAVIPQRSRCAHSASPQIHQRWPF